MHYNDIMILASIVFIICIIGIAALIKIKNNTYFIASMLLVFVISTTFACYKKPVLHKPFSINIIDYIVKFNTDGSVTTTKQSTTTIIKEDTK